MKDQPLQDRPAPLPPGHVAIPAGELFTIAHEYFAAERYDAAERILGHIFAGLPEQAEALHLQGVIELRRGNLDIAEALVERGIAAGDGKANAWRNLSEIRRNQGKLDGALAAARRAVALDPADAQGFFNLAMVLYDRLEISECIAAARAALDLKPGLPAAHMKLGQALLATGAFAEGWQEYEWRYQIPGAAPLMPPTDKPQWDGAPLGEGRLLLIGDQGYGDVIQFARYIPWARARCPNALLAVSQELIPLLERMFPGLPMVERWDHIGDYAAYCPLSGLPRLHGTALDSIPQTVPYLHPDPAHVAEWRARLDSQLPAGLRRVGLAWAGRPTHNNDFNRSTRLANFAPLGGVPGVAFVSLQKGQAVAQLAEFPGPAPLLDLDAQIGGFLDTAAIIAGLDLVICVDTSVGHVAGAQGRPAWLLLPHAPDWRWLLERADTPWYPATRLYRQPQPRDWAALIERVAGDLAVFAAG
jgi:hypothetical protein